MKRVEKPRRRLGALIVAAVVAFGISSAVRPARARAPDCIQVSSEALYRNMGYDHVVHIVNACEEAATCVVSTNVNPEEQKVTVPSKERVDVLTFRGSPARAFVPRVACQLASESR